MSAAPESTLGTTYPTFGEALRAARKNAGLTQGEFGKQAGVWQETVSKWENGHDHPRAERLPELAGVLGCVFVAAVDGWTVCEDEAAPTRGES